MVNVKSNWFVNASSFNELSFWCFLYFRKGIERMLWFSMGITQIDIEILFAFVSNTLPFAATYRVLYVLIYEKAHQLHSNHNQKEFQHVLQEHFSHIAASVRDANKRTTELGWKQLNWNDFNKIALRQQSMRNNKINGHQPYQWYR